MKRAIIVCEMIKEEIKQMIQDVDYELDVFYMESKLHNNPDNLRQKVQQLIDELYGYDEILLTYGLCGNGMAGIKATNCPLAYPKVDDCICAMMNTDPNYPDYRRDAYFTSRGWLTQGETFDNELKRIHEKYDEKRAKKILEMLYGHYKRLIYMQAEESVSEEHRKKAQAMANAINLDLQYKKASLGYFQDLLNEVHTDKIGITPVGESLKFTDFIEV